MPATAAAVSIQVYVSLYIFVYRYPVFCQRRVSHAVCTLSSRYCCVLYAMCNKCIQRVVRVCHSCKGPATCLCRLGLHAVATWHTRLIIHTTTRIITIISTLSFLSTTQVDVSTQHFYQIPKHVNSSLRGYLSGISAHPIGCCTSNASHRPSFVQH